MSWRPPELPKMEKMPERRGPRRPSVFGRVLAGLAGVVLGTSAAIGALQAFSSSDAQASAFGPLALLIPTAMLFRYATTGHARIG